MTLRRYNFLPCRVKYLRKDRRFDLASEHSNKPRRSAGDAPHDGRRTRCQGSHPFYSLSQSQFHQQQAEALSSTSPAEALTHYTTAIELYLKIASNTNAPAPQRNRCRSACQALITKAEAVKKRPKEQFPTSPASPRSIGPARKRGPVLVGGKLSVKEETILLKSSRINGGKYPPLQPGSVPVTTRPEQDFV